MTRRLLLCTLCCCLLAGCQHDPPNLSGTYAGTLESSSGVATVTVQLSEIQGALSGTAEGSGLGFQPVRYVLTGGHHDGGSVDLDISVNSQADPYQTIGFGCAYRLNGAGDASALAGTFFTHSCDSGFTGTFHLSRQ